MYDHFVYSYFCRILLSKSTNPMRGKAEKTGTGFCKIDGSSSSCIPVIRLFKVKLLTCKSIITAAVLPAKIYGGGLEDCPDRGQGSLFKRSDFRKY